MACQRFKQLMIKAAMVRRQYAEAETFKVDRFFEEAVNHILHLRTRHKNLNCPPVTPYIKDSEWEWIARDILSGDFKHREKLVAQGWQFVLLDELRNLENIVHHV